MKRVDDMAARLPALYREGEIVRQFLGQPGVQIEVVEEYAARVQRAHWFDETFELAEAGALAALLDFTPEPWQTLDLFRAWVHSQRDATLLNGAVTVAGISRFLSEYKTGFEDATDIKFEQRSADLVEYPKRRRYAAAPSVGGLAPLSRFSIEMRGLDETVASILLTGLSGGPESVPVVVNLTTGEGLVFLGNVAAGERLWLQARDDGSITARLERVEVTAQLLSVNGLIPGAVWDSRQVHNPPRALRLARGINEFWFLTVAHFDALGLDRFLLGLADLALKQGRWEETQFDHALFYQDPGVQLRMTWLETEPASFQARLPLGLALRRATAPGRVENDREQFAKSVDVGVDRLRAAGVRSEVLALSLTETQASCDFLTETQPVSVREVGGTGSDRVPDKGGVFGVTGFGDSTYR
jgi:hypothetical protein